MESKLQIRIDSKIKEEANKHAKELGINISALVRMLLIKEIKGSDIQCKK